MAVITIARGYGTGGEDIARRIAELLGIRYLDREITSQVAVRAGVSEQTLLEVSRRPGLLTRMAELLSRYPMDDMLSWTVAGMPTTPIWNHDSCKKLLDEFLKSVAASEDCVIVGWGAQATLQNHPGVLRCLFWSPRSMRVQHTMLNEGLDERAAERKVDHYDREWRGWMQAQYGVDHVSMHHYDVVLNVGRVGHDSAVRTVIDAARAIDQLVRW